MKNFFGTSRGEFFATITLLLLILASFVFFFTYDKKRVLETDFTEFRHKVDEFYAQQQAYADSMAAARAARDSAFARRYAQSRNHFSHHYPKYKNQYQYSNYQYDTTKLRPLEKKKSYSILKVDLNDCDTSDIMRVPQFGSKRAQKIVEYRKKLGGFHSLNQLHEIYILQNVDLKYCEKYFYVNQQEIKKIYVNSASYKEMVSHPYFDAYLVKTILQYRSQNGKIKDLQEFRQVTHAYAELMQKLSPYLAFD